MRLPVPAAAGTLAAFSANGLFAGLSGLFLATTLHQTSHALAGVALFLVFACGVVPQVTTGRLSASRVLALGTISHARGSGAARCLRPPVHPEPGHVPDLGWADRRGFWCRLQGDAGIALDLGASAPNTVLGFAILVGLGVAVSGWMLLVRKPNQKEI